MLIQLRQTEIETALKMYIASQGISLEGRTVDITFTSGRGGNGLTADLDIHDEPAIINVLEAIPTDPIKRAPARSEEKFVPEETVVEEDVVPEEPDDVFEQAPVESKTSLFG